MAKKRTKPKKRNAQVSKKQASAAKYRKPVNVRNIVGGLLLLACLLIAVVPAVVSCSDEFSQSATDVQTTSLSKRYSYFSYVYDDSGVLSGETESFVRDQAKKLEELTSAQVVVATTPDTAGLSLEEYSLSVANNLGIGNAELDNGVFIVFTTQEPHVRLEVGRGLEGRITDGRAGRILDAYAVEAKNAGDWDRAARDTFVAVVTEVYAEYGMGVPAGLTLTNGELATDATMEEGIASLEASEDSSEWLFIGGLILWFAMFVAGVAIIDVGGTSSSGSYYGSSSDWGGSSGGSSSDWGSSSSGGSFGGGSFGGGGASR